MRHILFLLFVSGFTGLPLTRCASIPVEEKIFVQGETNKTALAMVERSNLTAEEKTFIGRALTDSLDMAKAENKEKQKAKIENAGLRKYRNYFIAFVTAVALCLGGAAWLYIKKRAVPGL